MTYGPFPANPSARIGREWRRVRKEGVVPVARDHAGRLGDGFRGRVWGLRHGSAPNAVPVFVVGIQRSGTDMVIESLRRAPEIEVHNEHERSRAFCDYQLRDDETIAELVRSSRQRRIAFKALCDSDRVVHLMEELDAPSPGRAIWVVRGMEARVRSTLARWPENNRRVLRAVAAGDEGRWEGRGLSEESRELIRSFDYDAMSQASAAALLWLVRNSLYFELGLDERTDVALVGYERILERPQDIIAGLCEFLSVPYRARMTAHIAPRPPATGGSLDVDPMIAQRCAELEARFARALAGGAPSAASVPS
jgi:hypothetical protein